MATLAELARGPDITGSISRGAQAGGQLAQLAQLRRQNTTADALDKAFAGGIPNTPEARQATQQEAFRTGGFQAGLGVRDLFGQLDESRRQAEAREGQTIARELSGVSDQDSYTQALARLQANPDVDVSRLPPQFDPNLRTSIINAVREIEDIVGDVRSPEAQAQALERAQAGRSQTSINVDAAGNRLPPPPSGFMYVTDAQGGVSLSAIPGGPAAQDAAAAEAQQASQQESVQRTANVVQSNVDNVRSLIESADLPTTGFTGSLLSNIGGTAARDIAASLDTIRANVGFGALQEMRNNSPTGGALGQVSERELSLLTATLGNLEQSQSKGQLLRNLSEIERQFNVLTNGTPEERDQLLAEGPQTTGGIDQMTLEQLQSIDPDTLSDEDLAAAARRFNELNSGR